MPSKLLIDLVIEKIESKIGEKALLAICILAMMTGVGIMQWKSPISGAAWLGILITSLLYALLLAFVGWKVKRQESKHE